MYAVIGEGGTNVRGENITRLEALLPMLTDAQVERLLLEAREMAFETAENAGKEKRGND